MERGQVRIFRKRAIHSIAYAAGSRFIRVTGIDAENIPRGRHNSEAGTVVVEKRPNFSRRRLSFKVLGWLRKTTEKKLPYQSLVNEILASETRRRVRTE